MANRRIIVKRRKAVRNIRKITRTMQLIATARFQSAFGRATASKPYSDKLAEVVADLARSGAGLEHPLAVEPESEQRSAHVVVTSSRGLAGGYNANVLRTAIEHEDVKAAAEVTSEVIMARVKGINYFNFLKRPMAEEIAEITDMPSFDEVEPIAERLMDRFKAKELDSAYVTFMRFYSAGKQVPETVRLLPLSSESPAEEASGAAPDYEFSPAPEELLAELLPATVRIRLYQAFLDAAVSEQVARMVAMKGATDAAEDRIKQLTREYNRARQTAVTMELLDIVGGANALE